MNKQERLKQLQDSLKFEKDLQANYKESIKNSVERVIDINDEIQEIERDIMIENTLNNEPVKNGLIGELSEEHDDYNDDYQLGK